MEKIYVEVIKAENSYWYSNHIGAIFPVVGTDDLHGYMLFSDVGKSYGNRYINRNDCRVVNVSIPEE